MLESAFTRKLLKALRSHAALRDYYIVKHNDLSTGGIPDFSVSCGTKTLWFEVKLLPNMPTRLQQHTLDKLGPGAVLVSVSKDCKRAALDTRWMPASMLADEIAKLVTGKDCDD